jgi:hypothetical protein
VEGGESRSGILRMERVLRRRRREWDRKGKGKKRRGITEDVKYSPRQTPPPFRLLSLIAACGIALTYQGSSLLAISVHAFFFSCPQI